MADTGGLFSLRYQTLADAPDGAGLGQNLATDTAGWLARAYPVLNAAARTALTVTEGFLCRQRDDGTVWVYTDLASWAQIGGGGSGGSGSGIGALEGEWSASATQTFGTSSTEYAVAFGNEGHALAGVTRSAKGAGHKFSCTAGTYWASANVRFAAGATGSRFIGLRTEDDNTQYWSTSNDGGPSAATRQFAGPVVLGSTTAIYVVASQSSGGSLATQPTSGSQNPSGYVKFSLTRLG